MRRVTKFSGGALRALFVGLVLTQLLAACETLPVANVAPNANVVIARHFSLAARLSVRTGERMDSAKLVWVKDRHDERLQFFTPFGSQLAEVWQAEGGRAFLKQGKELVAAESLAVLTESLLGVGLDTDEIGQWIQGVGLEDGIAREMRIHDGSTWRVTAERMQGAPAAERPGITHRYAARLTAINAGTTIRLVIDEWRAL